MEPLTKRWKILRPNEVAEMLGVSRVTLWRWEKRRLLPAKRRIGPNTVGWVETEIVSWLESRPSGPADAEETGMPARPRSKEV